MPTHAATRDASWYATHRQTITAAAPPPVVYHVDKGGWQGACANQPLVETSAIALERVAKVLRCQRAGCKKHWPPEGAE